MPCDHPSKARLCDLDDSVMALGIGATTEVFGLIEALLLKSLPVREPDRSSTSAGRRFPTRSTRTAGARSHIFSSSSRGTSRLFISGGRPAGTRRSVDGERNFYRRSASRLRLA